MSHAQNVPFKKIFYTDDDYLVEVDMPVTLTWEFDNT